MKHRLAQLLQRALGPQRSLDNARAAATEAARAAVEREEVRLYLARVPEQRTRSGAG